MLSIKRRWQTLVDSWIPGNGIDLLVEFLNSYGLMVNRFTLSQMPAKVFFNRTLVFLKMRILTSVVRMGFRWKILWHFANPFLGGLLRADRTLTLIALLEWLNPFVEAAIWVPRRLSGFVLWRHFVNHFFLTLRVTKFALQHLTILYRHVCLLVCLWTVTSSTFSQLTV